MICQLFISPGHNYFGHHEKPPGEYEVIEVSEVECIAGRGLRGDRFFDYKTNYKGQITFFAVEVYEDLCQKLAVTGKPAAVFRRNVLTRGLELNSLVGQEFEIQGIRFRGTSECSPCHWMDRAFAPGAEVALKGRGGLRAKILSSGWLYTDAA